MAELFTNQATGTVTTGGTTAPAQGTVESWTVNVSAAFPVVSAGTSFFYGEDPNAVGEIFLVSSCPGGTGSQTWSQVTRGARGTTPVAHNAGGFTVQQVITDGSLGGFAQAGSGDLGGTGAAPTVAKLQGTTLAAPPGDPSSFLGSDGNWTPPPGFYPPIGNPRINRAAILTQFQAGHGFTLAGGDATSNINDATTGNFVVGSQAATVVTKGDGSTFANLSNTGLSFDSTGKYLLVRFRASTVNSLGALHLDIANDSAFTNFYRWDFHENYSLGGGYTYDGEWETITFGFADAQVNGSPARTGLTAVKLRARDTGSKVTVQWQEVALVSDPAATFPNGVVTICFDDGYQTQYDNGRPVLDQYGFRATMHLIRDGVGGSGSLTWPEVTSLQNVNGWEISCHADTSAVHQANDTGVSSAVLEQDYRDQKAYYNANGYHGVEFHAYPSGIWNPTVTAINSKYFRCSRITNFMSQETFPPAQPSKLRALGQITSFAGGHSAALVNSMIDSAKANRQWLILIFHKIVTGTPGANTECSLTDFQTIMSHLSSSGVPVRTMGEVMRAASYVTALP